ncbi:hypothetical protein BpHYR1_047380, partial [Brachionus plicatilis]
HLTEDCDSKFVFYSKIVVFNVRSNWCYTPLNIYLTFFKDILLNKSIDSEATEQFKKIQKQFSAIDFYY